MYSELLKEILDSISEISEHDNVLSLIDKSMLCYLDSIANQIDGELYPSINHLDVLVQTSLLSSTIADNPHLPHIEKLHYLIGMILEQQGELIIRNYSKQYEDVKPEENDFLYYQTLAVLHYLAGGYRIQAKTIINNIASIVNHTGNESYKNAYRDIKQLFSNEFDFNRRTFFISNNKISNLIKQIQQTHTANLNDLGLSNEDEWLLKRGINSPYASHFWRRYLLELSNRGVTTFTKEQINKDFNSWLRIDKDLIVVLPTGSGKTLFGELKTALTLANEKQVVWLLPMRSLVRQTQREMSKAFKPLKVQVRELPTTDDFIPLFAEIQLNEPTVAITTPEKFQALIRVNPDVMQNIGLVVVDEAQNLFENRGFAIELDLLSITSSNPECKIVFLSAMADKADKLVEFYRRLRPEMKVTSVISSNRPTRCSYGVFTSIKEDKQIPAFLCYPALVNKTDRAKNPRTILLPKSCAFNPIKVQKLINKYLRFSHDSKLRSIIFVNQKKSAELRAKEIVSLFNSVPISEEMNFDLNRIDIERGASSPFEKCFSRKIAPHHSSLPKIEQIFIEKWIRKGFITQVVSTPTLAQGVNLPFDISMISFFSRYENGKNKELTQAEVMNMLGRAGRAGMVSDGLALIVKENKTDEKSTEEILQQNSYWFFPEESSSDNFIGLSKILIKLLDDDFQPKDWVLELYGFDINEAMSMNILLAKVILDENEGAYIEKLKYEIAKFPSILDLQNRVGDDIDVATFFAEKLKPIIKELIKYPREVIQNLAITGLPVEFIESIIEHLKIVEFGDRDNPLDFANEIVEKSLSICKNRDWFIKFSKVSPTKSFEFDEGMTAIFEWINGSPWDDINNIFSSSFENKLVYTGSFINNKLPQLAQFWGCLAVCEKILFGMDSHHFDFIQAFIRNGVNSKEKLIVLKEFGNFDRVLSHRLTPFFSIKDLENITDIQNAVKRKIIRWKSSQESVPEGLSEEEVRAFKSLLVYN